MSEATAALVRLLSSVVALLIVAAAHSADPATAASAEFESGTAAFVEGDFARALRHFEAAQAAGVDGPAVVYNIGVAQYRLGHYGSAAATFRDLAARFAPMQPLADYNLGLALWRQGNVDAARAAFARAADSDDETVASLADAMLVRTAPAARTSPAQPRRLRTITLLDLKVGHDDDVVLVDESILPPGQRKESAFAEALVYAGGSPSSGSGPRFDASAYLIRHPDADRYDQTAIHIGGGWRSTFSDWRLDIGPIYGWNSLGSDAFEQRWGASVDLRRALSDRTALTLRLQGERVDALDRRFRNVAGRRDLLRIGLEQRGMSADLRLGFEVERNDRNDAGVSPDRMRVFARYRHRLNAEWLLEFGGGYRASRFRRLPDTRTEDLIELSVGAVRVLQRGWQLSAGYHWSDNDANVNIYSYRRNRVHAGVMRVF